MIATLRRFVSGSGYLLKAACTDWLTVTVRVQVLFTPEHAPLQLIKVLPARRSCRQSNHCSRIKLAGHALPKFMPASSLGTVPVLPRPIDTVNSVLLPPPAGLAVNWAFTVIAPGPANFELPPAFAVRVTIVPNAYVEAHLLPQLITLPGIASRGNTPVAAIPPLPLGVN